jgi:ribosomal protein L35
MPKLKTRKTLTRRIRVTRRGKLLKKQSRMGHLKVKMDQSRKTRKREVHSQVNRKHVRVLRKLLAKLSKGVKGVVK